MKDKIIEYINSRAKQNDDWHLLYRNIKLKNPNYEGIDRICQEYSQNARLLKDLAKEIEEKFITVSNIRILKITRVKAIEKLEKSMTENIIAMIIKEDYSWMSEVIGEGFTGLSTMNNSDLAQEYWEYFSHLETEYDDIEIF